MYDAIPCNCGHPICQCWHVGGVAEVHGVNFTKEQAEAVAKLLNRMEIEAEQRPPRHTDIAVPIATIEKAIAHVWERREKLAEIFGSRRPGDTATAAVGAIIGQLTIELAGQPGFDEDKLEENCHQPTTKTHKD